MRFEPIKDINHFSAIQSLNKYADIAARQRAKQIDDAIEQAIIKAGFVFNSIGNKRLFLKENALLVSCAIDNYIRFYIKDKLVLSWSNEFNIRQEGQLITFTFE